MKIHELIDEYKKISEDMKLDHEQAVKTHNRYIAYLQSLDPSRRVGTSIWDGFKDWCDKQDVLHSSTEHHAV